MSGFAGMVSTEGGTPDTQLLQRMANVLAFRGPDGTQVWTHPGAGLCFSLFRTGPAPQASQQPFTLEGRVWLLGDVRLDAREDLRRELEQYGDHTEITATDEELVLRVWRRWGEQGLAKLLGDFSFAIWDEPAHRVYAARDLMGARPFFYARSTNWLYFSNTLNAIRCAPDVSPELDLHFIGDFLLEGWCPDPERSAFRDVKRLPAGHKLVFSSEGLGVHRYTSLPIEEPLRFKREEEYVEQFRALFEQAVRERLPQGPSAILMSGGLDSTSVAAMAVHCAKRNGLPSQLKAYTMDYQPLFDDKEGSLASLAAQRVGIPIEIHSGASCLPYAGWDQSLPPMPEPIHEPFRSSHLEQLRCVAQHSRVVLTGYGGDGVLTGQAWPYLVDLARQLRFREISGTLGRFVLQHGRLPPLRGGFRAAIRKWVKGEDLMGGYPRWLTPRFEREARSIERWHELQKPFQSDHRWHPRAYAMLTGSLWPSVLESEEPVWTGVPVESRSPLLDQRIQRFLLRMPPVPLCVNKELLRQAMRNMLPVEISVRPKTPFQGDQIAIHTRNGSWSTAHLPPPAEPIQRFVNWQELRTALDGTPILFPWADLRPISLSYWLHGIERESKIQ